MTDAWRRAPLVDKSVHAALIADLEAGEFELILAAFGRDIALRAGQLSAALAAADIEAARTAVHSLKGAALNMGFLRLGELCGHLQALARAGALDELAASRDDFGQVCDDSLAELEQPAPP